MKRNLIVAAVLTLSANVALADWAFEDSYWKQSQTVRSVQTGQASQAGETRGKYDHVDGYNN